MLAELDGAAGVEGRAVDEAGAAGPATVAVSVAGRGAELQAASTTVDAANR